MTGTTAAGDFSGDYDTPEQEVGPLPNRSAVGILHHPLPAMGLEAGRRDEVAGSVPRRARELRGWRRQPVVECRTDAKRRIEPRQTDDWRRSVAGLSHMRPVSEARAEVRGGQANGVRARTATATSICTSLAAGGWGRSAGSDPSPYCARAASRRHQGERDRDGIGPRGTPRTQHDDRHRRPPDARRGAQLQSLTSNL